MPLTMEMALRDGVAALRDRAERVKRSIAADNPHAFVRQPGLGMNFCGVPGCSVNPWHLEPVTCAENIRRAPRARATHCQHGHEFTPENTRRYDGRRYCRACAAARIYARRNGLDFTSVARSRPTGVDLRRSIDIKRRMEELS